LAVAELKALQLEDLNAAVIPVLVQSTQRAVVTAL
jgi:hypothetical protein